MAKVKIKLKGAKEFLDKAARGSGNGDPVLHRWNVDTRGRDGQTAQPWRIGSSANPNQNGYRA